MSRRRPTYIPAQRGWISIQDKHSFVLGVIDCSQGGAQEAFERLCQDFERAGWVLEEPGGDTRFVKRGGQRWLITIYPDHPSLDDDRPRVLSEILPR